ncbi:MAG: hypothetical protein NUK65_12330 [Firmicutes bacterium]|nr:hypothetical protein [Bacillota bacterium]
MLYTVDEEKVAEYNKMEAAFLNVEIIEAGSVHSLSQEYVAMMQSFDEDIRILMTAKAYENIVASRFNTLSTSVCANGNYTLEVTDFMLDENSYDEKDNQAGYYYEAKVRFIASDGKDEQIDTANGYIGLVKENGQWKVDVFTTKPSKFYQEVLSNR